MEQAHAPQADFNSRLAHLRLLFAEGIWGKWLGLAWFIYGVMAAIKTETLSAQQQERWQVINLFADLLSISFAWWTAGIAAVIAIWLFEASYSLHKKAGTRLSEEQTTVRNLKLELTNRRAKKNIREQLGTFVIEGKKLLGRCSNEELPPPDMETTAWHENLKKFLNENLESSYVARLENPSGLPMTMNSIASVPHREMWSGIHFRLARLNQFLEELVD